MARKTKRPPIFTPITVDVQSLTNFAHYAGLTCESAERLTLAAPDEDTRIHERSCPSGECNGATTRHLIVSRAFEGRELIYCEDCGEADIWL